MYHAVVSSCCTKYIHFIEIKKSEMVKRRLHDCILNQHLLTMIINTLFFTHIPPNTKHLYNIYTMLDKC